MIHSEYFRRRPRFVLHDVLRGRPPIGEEWFSPEGRYYVFTKADDDNVPESTQIIDLWTGKPVATFTKYSKLELGTLRVSPDAKYVSIERPVGGKLRRVILETETAVQLEALECQIMSDAFFSSDGKFLIYKRTIDKKLSTVFWDIEARKIHCAIPSESEQETYLASRQILISITPVHDSTTDNQTTTHAESLKQIVFREVPSGREIARTEGGRLLADTLRLSPEETQLVIIHDKPHPITNVISKDPREAWLFDVSSGKNTASIHSVSRAELVSEKRLCAHNSIDGLRLINVETLEVEESTSKLTPLLPWTFKPILRVGETSQIIVPSLLGRNAPMWVGYLPESLLRVFGLFSMTESYTLIDGLSGETIDVIAVRRNSQGTPCASSATKDGRSLVLYDDSTNVIEVWDTQLSSRWRSVGVGILASAIIMALGLTARNTYVDWRARSMQTGKETESEGGMARKVRLCSSQTLIRTEFDAGPRFRCRTAS